MSNIWAPRGSMIKSNMGMINTPGPVRPSDSDDLETLALLTLGGKMYDSADKAGYVSDATNALKYGVTDTMDFFTPGFLGGKNFLDFEAFQGAGDDEIDTKRDVKVARENLAQERDPKIYKMKREAIEEALRKYPKLREPVK